MSTKSDMTSSVFLSDDILRLIFVLLAQDSSRIEEDWKWYAIAHVCHRWRTVALDTGTFWSNIICFSTSLDMIKTQLTRSKGADLGLTFMHKSYTLRPSRHEETLYALLVHKERITTMHLRMYDILWNDFRAFVDPFPSRLNTLYINIHFRPDVMNPILKTVSLKNILASKDLRRLSITYLTLREISGALSSLQPLQNLVEVTFNNVNFDWRYLHEVIRICPNLENLTIVTTPMRRDISDNTGFPFDLSPHVQLLSLRNLKIHGFSIFQAYRLFQNFTLPVDSKWELKCFSPPSFRFQSSDEDHDLQKTMIHSLFNRHSHCDTFHIALGTHRTVLRTESSTRLGEAQHSSVIPDATTNVLLEHHFSDQRITNNERCSFLSQLIRSTDWRKAKVFHFHFKSGEGEITNDKWVDLLGSFENLSSLEIMLPVCSPRPQTDLSVALKYAADHDVLKSTLKCLSFKMLRYDKGFIDAVKYFLSSTRYKDAKISKLIIEYPNLPRESFGTAVQNLFESLSGYAQELRVEKSRSLTAMYRDSD